MPAATTLIQPLAWELPYAKGVTIKKKKKKKNKELLASQNEDNQTLLVL